MNSAACHSSGAARATAATSAGVSALNSSVGAERREEVVPHDAPVVGHGGEGPRRAPRRGAATPRPPPRTCAPRRVGGVQGAALGVDEDLAQPLLGRAPGQVTLERSAPAPVRRAEAPLHLPELTGPIWVGGAPLGVPARDADVGAEEHVAGDAQGRPRPGGVDFGRPPDPFQPPEAPGGKINLTDLDSRNVKILARLGAGLQRPSSSRTDGADRHRRRVTNVDSPDFGHLEPMVAAARAELARGRHRARRRTVVLADAGYWHQVQMEAPRR